MFSKRHYETIAKRFAWIDAPNREAKDYATETLADLFAEDNPNFDRARFLKACGVGE